MNTAIACLLALGLTSGHAHAQDAHAEHAQSTPAAPSTQSPTPAAPRSGIDALPADEDQARAALDKSPRHGEYADVAIAGGAPVRAWVVYPERSDKAPVVIVIHEIFGLSDWIRAVADQFARDGFIAIAPDLLSGKGPGQKGTDAFASRDDVVNAVRGLDPGEVTARLDAVRDYGLKLPASNGRTVSVGFCWGGSTSFRYATTQPALDAAVVFYGSSPETPALAAVKAPVLGLYGGDDARVNATIDAARAELTRLGRTYETEIYAGAGHGFLRQQTGREGANMKATEAAWPRVLAFVRAHAAR